MWNKDKYIDSLPSESDYMRARKLGLTDGEKRIKSGELHHPMSRRIMSFIEEHDFIDYNDFFCWKSGGDGDNGEALMWELDAFFEFLDATEKKDNIKCDKCGSEIDVCSSPDKSLSLCRACAVNNAIEVLSKEIAEFESKDKK